MEIEMKCIMGELNHPNRNGRIYDSKMMQEAIDKWKKEGSKIVELNPDYNNFTTTNISKAVGITKDIWVENGEVLGKIELLDTPQGKIVKDILKSGQNVNFAPRMLGERVPVLDEEGNQKIDKYGNPIYEIKNVEIVSLDIV